MRGTALLFGLSLSLAALAKGHGVTFHCEPRDAQILVQLPGQALKPLGQANQEILLDDSLFAKGHAVTIVFHRAGWKDAVLPIQEEGQRTDYFDRHDRYPEQGSVELSPDPAGRFDQFLYQFKQSWPLLFLIAAGLGGGAWFWRKRSQRYEYEFDDEEDEPSAPTSVLADYQRQHQLGKGPASVVFQAVRVGGPPVAVKILTHCADPVGFLRQAEICARTVHPHLVRVLDWGQDGHNCFLIMELLHGTTVRELLLKQGRPDPRAAITMLLPVLGGVHALHGQGVMHCNLKPENLFLTDHGVLKAMEFGTPSTQTYMAPEQLQGQLQRSVDQYALGAIMCELVTGVPPRPGVPPPVPGVPDRMAQILLRMLHPDPSKRYPDLEAASQALQRAL